MSQETLTEEEYIEEVEEQASHLREAVEDTDEPAIQLVVDTLDAHKWFQSGSGEITPRDYGAIISIFEGFGGNVEQYRDTEMITAGEDWSTILRKMAYAQFEADVLSAHKSMQNTGAASDR